MGFGTVKTVPYGLLSYVLLTCKILVGRGHLTPPRHRSNHNTPQPYTNKTDRKGDNGFAPAVGLFLRF